jgi:hypothetical protein
MRILDKCVLPIFAFSFLLTSCTKKPADTDCFIRDNRLVNNEEVHSLSSIFKDYKFIRLETSDISLIGKQIIKIKKHENRYYILSDRKEILVYDDNGKYIFKISKLGMGPGEYNILSDFDISENNDIVILDAQKIITYDNQGKLKNSQPINITGFNIKCLKNEKFLICASGEKYVLYVLDKDGAILEKNFKNKLSTRIGSDVPFINISPNQIIFQIGFSNDFICYNTDKNFFSTARLLCDKECISTQEEDRLMKIYGLNYLEKSPDTNTLYGMAAYEKYLLYKIGNNEKYNIYFKNTDNQAEYMVSSNTIDDISYSTPDLLLDYAHYGNAENCFISYFYPFQLNINNNNSAYNDKYKELIHQLTINNVDLNDENPVLFEFTIK